MCVHGSANLGTRESQESVSGLLKLELQLWAAPDEGAGNGGIRYLQEQEALLATEPSLQAC